MFALLCSLFRMLHIPLIVKAIVTLRLYLGEGEIDHIVFFHGDGQEYFPILCLQLAAGEGDLRAVSF